MTDWWCVRTWHCKQHSHLIDIHSRETNRLSRIDVCIYTRLYARSSLDKIFVHTLQMDMNLFDRHLQLNHLVVEIFTCSKALADCVINTQFKTSETMLSWAVFSTHVGLHLVDGANIQFSISKKQAYILSTNTAIKWNVQRQKHRTYICIPNVVSRAGYKSHWWRPHVCPRSDQAVSFGTL